MNWPAVVLSLLIVACVPVLVWLQVRVNRLSLPEPPPSHEDRVRSIAEDSGLFQKLGEDNQ